MRIVACLLLSVLVAGCFAAEAPPEPGAPTPALREGDLRFPGVMVLHEGRGALHDAPMERVAEDEAALRALWDELQPTPLGDPPRVDFARERVVLVSLGNVGTFPGGDRSCDALRPGGVEDAEDGAVVVTYVRVAPPKEWMCQVLAEHPHFLAAIPHGAPVRFEARREQAQSPPPAPESRGVFPMADGRDSPVAGPVARVFETEAAWRAFWGEAGAPEAWQNPSWGEHHVALVILGERPNDCHEVGGGTLEIGPGTGRATFGWTEIVPAEGVQCNAGAFRPYAAWFFEPAGIVELAFESGTRERFVDRPGPPVPVAYEVLANVTFDLPARTSQMWRLEEEADWLAFWDAHAPEGAQRPGVDFEQRRVAVITLGPPHGACDRLQLENVTRDAHLDAVEIRLAHRTGGGDGCEPAPLQIALALERDGTMGYSSTRVSD